MYIKRRMPLVGAICKYGLIIIIVVALSIYMHNKLSHYQELTQRLNQIVAQQTETIEEMQEKNSALKIRIAKLKEEKDKLNKKIKKMSKKPKLQSTSTLELTQKTSHNDFKSYMSYKAITNTSSMQYKLQQKASTDTNGLRCINGNPLVAVGTGWGLSVGDTALVICDNGNRFKVVIGDIKANQHTDSQNKTTVSNGCRCEFIVDMNYLNTTAKQMGNVAVLKQYSGYITNIIKI